MYSNTPKIVGAGNDPKKFTMKKTIRGKMQKKTPFIAQAKLQKAVLKSWQDRNLKNRGSKLNP